MVDAVNTSPNLNQNLAEPGLSDLLDLFERHILLNTNCHHIATIQNFDETQQTATVTINYTRTFYTRDANGVYTAQQQDYPPVEGPVIVLGGGSQYLSFPLTVGDECLVCFNDRDLDNWYSFTQKTPVATGRLHAFSDAIIIAGLRSFNNRISDYDPDKVVLGKKSKAHLWINPTTNKLQLANETKNLNTLLQQLLIQLNTLATDIAALTVTGVTPGGGISGVPSNASSFTTIASQINTIATNIGGLLE